MKSSKSKKEIIIEKSELLFSEHGYNATGITEIINTSDISKGSFYYYFPNGKKELAIEVLNYINQKLSNQLTACFDSNTTIKDCYKDYLTHKKQGSRKQLHSFSRTLALLSMELSWNDTELKELCQEILNTHLNIHKNNLMKYGWSDAQASQMAVQIVSIINGILYSSWIFKKDQHIDEILNAIYLIIDTNEMY